MEQPQMKSLSSGGGSDTAPCGDAIVTNGKTPLTDKHISILLSTASKYSDSAAKSFDLFIKVLFASLAFATAVSRAGGSTTTPSVLMAVALLAFYAINFVAFQSANIKLAIVLREMSQQIECWDFKNSETLSVFQPERPRLCKLGLPSVGYLIGSALGFGGFVWILFV